MMASASARGVKDLLAQLARELSTLQSMADEIETSVGQLLGPEDAGVGASGIQNLQLLDILNQSLQALSTCCANAARISEPGWEIDGAAATGGIALTGIARRLAGAGAANSTSGEDDCELFPER